MAFRRPGLIAGLLASFVLGAIAPAAEPPAEWPALREATFTMTWQTVNDAYFDPRFGGIDWVAIREKYHARLGTVADRAELRGLLRAMLGELQKTHFAILSRDAAIYQPGDRVRGGTTGMEVRAIGHEVFVARVEAGSPAAASGLKPGDAVLRIGDQSIEQIAGDLAQSGQTPVRQTAYLTALVASRLQSPIGSMVSMIVTPPGGEARLVGLNPAPGNGTWSEPIGNLPAQLLQSKTEIGPDGVGYLRFNIFMPSLMKEIRTLLKKLQPGDGLVIDLRGNLGGVTTMAQAICGWLTKDEFSLGKVILRRGFSGLVATPQDGAFLGPVAVLIDHASASTSEILAAGLQDAGRALVFVETSAGAALPSVFKTLPTGDLLQYAIADLQTAKGRRLEGLGVTPDEIVEFSRDDLVAGRDPVLAVAHAWLETQRKKVPAKAAGKL